MACDVLAFVLRSERGESEKSEHRESEKSEHRESEKSEHRESEKSEHRESEKSEENGGIEVHNPARNDETPSNRNDGTVDSEKPPAENDKTEDTFDSLATLIFTALSHLVLEIEKEGPVPSLDTIAPKVTPCLFSHE